MHTVKIEFSELDYSYGASREFENGTWLFPPLGMPKFPNLRKEAEVGYDICFENELFAPVFIQYKLPRKLIRETAREWDIFQRPYYRFMIYPHHVSPQHNILVDLSLQQDFVFYLSPAFASYEEYCNHFADRTITDNSIFIPCNLLPEVGYEYHYITYTDALSGFYWCSEPKYYGSAFTGTTGLVNYCRERVQQFYNLERLLEILESYIQIEGMPPKYYYKQDLFFRLSVVQNLFLRQKSLAMGIIRKKDRTHYDNV